MGTQPLLMHRSRGTRDVENPKEASMFNFEEELKKLPKEPGVYIMRDDRDVILYVGKAVNLHNRVRSYFRENI